MIKKPIIKKFEHVFSKIKVLIIERVECFMRIWIKL